MRTRERFWWATGHRGSSRRIEIWEYYQVGDNMRRTGLGLGLSIVQRLEDLLRRPIGVRSQIGKSSTGTAGANSHAEDGNKRQSFYCQRIQFECAPEERRLSASGTRTTSSAGHFAWRVEM